MLWVCVRVRVRVCGRGGWEGPGGMRSLRPFSVAKIWYSYLLLLGYYPDLAGNEGGFWEVSCLI